MSHIVLRTVPGKVYIYSLSLITWGWGQCWEDRKLLEEYHTVHVEVGESFTCISAGLIFLGDPGGHITSTVRT